MARSRLLSMVAAAALVATAAVSVPLTAGPAVAADRGIRVAGSLQSEAGCASDWDPGCDATRLPQVGDTDAYRGSFELPAGSYEFKVTVGGSWDESYGANGVLDGANIPLVLGGPTEVAFGYDDVSHAVVVTAARVTGPVSAADAGLAGDSLREGLTRERYYFVMADRFANGSKANDKGGLTGDRLSTGLDPTDRGFYHGGDLAGLTSKLDYIKGLGSTAIWLTPTFKNKPVQGLPGAEDAGYHGYWITDFTQIDPHLGTNAEMSALIDAAHAKGMKVFFDIITNHTADVVNYQEGQYSYIDKATSPYRNAAGEVFDDAEVAGSPSFPRSTPRRPSRTRRCSPTPATRRPRPRPG